MTKSVKRSGEDQSTTRRFFSHYLTWSLLTYCCTTESLWLLNAIVLVNVLYCSLLAMSNATMSVTTPSHCCGISVYSSFRLIISDMQRLELRIPLWTAAGLEPAQLSICNLMSRPLRPMSMDKRTDFNAVNDHLPKRTKICLQLIN